MPGSEKCDLCNNFLGLYKVIYVNSITFVVPLKSRWPYAGCVCREQEANVKRVTST